MKIRRFFAFASVLLSCAAVSQSPPSITPQIVVVPSGNLRLKGYLWRPAGAAPSPAVLFVHGSGSTDASHTSGFAITEAAERLAPTFIKHGYAFLYLFRCIHPMDVAETGLRMYRAEKKARKLGCRTRQDTFSSPV